MSDDAIDRWLRDALGAEAPRLSSDFDARVLSRVRARRLSRGGRLALSAYGAVALAVSAWLLRDVDASLAALATLAGGVAAQATSRYVQRVFARQ